MCFLSTPDGENCGLVKNLAVTAVVSSKVLQPSVDNLMECGMKKLDEVSLESMRKMGKVFLNGDWAGVCLDMSSFADRLRCMRRGKQIDPQVSCYFVYFE